MQPEFGRARPTPLLVTKDRDGQTVEVLTQEHHRNGVGGAPFVATTLLWDGNYAVAMSFPAEPPEQTAEARRALFIEQTGVVLPTHPEEHWRGADYLGAIIADLYHERKHNPEDEFAFPYCAWEDPDCPLNTGKELF